MAQGDISRFPRQVRGGLLPVSEGVRVRAMVVVLVAAMTLGLSPQVALADDASAADPATATSAPAAVNQALALAQGKGKAADSRGVLPSLYRGKWFVKKAEWKRKCIIRRETHANYRSVSAGGTYRGAYQMRRALALGALHAMEPEVRKEMGAEGVSILRKLRKTPTQQWNRYWQDRAFWTVWHKGSGRGHWNGAGCGKGS